MKLLISAYACAPNRGSDHAVGWNWVTEAHQLGHEIWALVSPVHRDAIKQACERAPDLAGIHWIFPSVKGWRIRQTVEPKWERTYNFLWQKAAVPHARRLQNQIGFDAVHHLTWAGIRAPTFLGSLSAPLIIGPVGGGETSPVQLRDDIGAKGRLLERLRDFSNSTIMMNPIVRSGLNSASVIFVSTTDTQKLFKGDLRDKTVVFTQLGLSDFPAANAPRSWSSSPRFLYAGRLLYWKGIHIAIRAFVEIVKQIPEARFTIVGSGSERSKLAQACRENGIESSVEFISRIPQNELFDLYRSHDLFLFPSLHDSGGFVVLEALSYGLPVVCLDLGGPKDIVTPDCGLVVSTKGLTTAQVADVMARDVCRLISKPGKLAELSQGALLRAREFDLAQRIDRLYACATELVKQKA
jgi:glycosyltransferase involved in cell wall biosynthesis